MTPATRQRRRLPAEIYWRRRWRCRRRLRRIVRSVDELNDDPRGEQDDSKQQQAPTPVNLGGQTAPLPRRWSHGHNAIFGGRSCEDRLAMNSSPDRRRVLHERILGWFDHAERALPWRGNATPWAVMVSEFMLQQTPVVR